MKKIIAIISLAFIASNVSAQVRGTYGTVTPWQSLVGTLNKVVRGVPTPVATGLLDTLVNADTGYVYVSLNNNFDATFDLYVTTISGTLAGSSVLQESTDGVNWYAITGNTTYCASCIGASATLTNTPGPKDYQWYLPVHAVGSPKYRIQIISTGTSTASYTGTIGIKY